uniref:E3 SUMO-protein ligase PIAS1-like n=1 Tax=Crassostrea virginica TaxID=6565 RepID=A0A8B8BF50_CRAVI|nr:E3 SUMO-protein ligase PIAS1-like [Crassostrea virginica]
MDLLLRRTLWRRNSLFVHEDPDVKFTKLPFYECVAELMQPKPLVAEWFCESQTNYFKFVLSSEHFKILDENRKLNTCTDADCEYTIQIQVRFCMLGIYLEQDDCFPKNLCVHVNGKIVTLPCGLQSGEVRTQRPGYPLDITSLCHLSRSHPVSNQIKVSWEDSQNFCVTVLLVKKFKINAMLGRLKQSGFRDANNTKTTIKHKLPSDADCEIISTCLRTSLICPLSMKRMEIPIRTESCTHLQCFDAQTFLRMNIEKSVWRCPICDKPAPLNQIVIDGLLVEILKETIDNNEIQFNENGSWSPVETSENVVHYNSAKRKSGIEDLGFSPFSSESPPKKSKVDVIDLTLSSDEESNDQEWIPFQPVYSIDHFFY